MTCAGARNGATATTYYPNTDLVATVTTPSPGPGYSAQTITIFYDTSLRAWKITQPDGASITNEFFSTGQLKKTSGSRTYSAEYSYDYAGRMSTMKNWRNFPNSGTATTTWNYDEYRGWLSSKRYPDKDSGEPSSTGPDYDYTAAGRLATRLWARETAPSSGVRIKTDYDYNLAGDLESVTYNDSITPDLTCTYDRRGRQKTVTRHSSPVTTVTLTYNNANQLLSEAYSGGTLDGLPVTNGYDQLLRRTNLAAVSASAVLSMATNSFDAASRLAVVSDRTNSATYSYLADSPLVSQITFKSNNAVRMTTTKQHDFLNRLTSISSASSAVSFSYAHARRLTKHAGPASSMAR